MLVEFSELLDKNELSPVATNMTVEAMPNDNLVRTSINKSSISTAGVQSRGKSCEILSTLYMFKVALLIGDMAAVLFFLKWMIEFHSVISPLDNFHFQIV